MNVRAPEGSSLESTTTILDSIAKRVNELPEVEVHAAHHRRRPAEHAEPRLDLRQAQAGERAQADQFAVMDDIRREILPQYERLHLRAQVQPVAAFGGGNNAEIQFWIGGPDLDQLEKYSDVLMQKLKTLPGGGGRRHEPHRRQARARRPHRPGQGRRPGRARPGPRLDPERARGRAQGHGLLRGRRAVRGAPPGGRLLPPRRGGHRPGRGAVAAGPGPAQGRGALRGVHGPLARQPPGAPAAGAALRQHAARLLGADDHGRPARRRRRS